MQNKYIKSKENVSRFVNKVLLIESRLPGSLQGYFALAGVIPIAVALFVLPKLPATEILELLCIALFFFFGGCVGAISATRKELPQFIPLTGRPAFILGTLLAIIGWGGVLYTFYIMIMYILQG